MGISAKKAAVILLKAAMGGFGKGALWKEQREPSRQVQKVKVRHQHAQTHKIIERETYQFSGIECLCGCTSFHKKIERFPFVGGFVETYSFRCAKCKLVPISMSPITRKFFNEPSSRRALEWIGVILPEGKL